MASAAPSHHDMISDRARGARLLLFALVVTALAYLGSLRFGFVYDDAPQIVLNPTLNSWTYLPRLFTEHSWKFLFPDWPGNYYRPLFMAWLLLNRKLFGFYEPAWHATTVLIHLLATWMSFVVARQLLRNSTLAGFVAILFGLHPIHVEAVAWISGVTEPLMALFALAAFWAWIKSEREPDHRILYQALSVIFYAAACLSKETALLLPIVVVAHDLLRGQYDRNGTGVVRATVHAWPLWITAAAYLTVRAAVLRGLVHSVKEPFAHVLLTIPAIFWGYMRRLVWPVNLSVYYDTPPVLSPFDHRFWLPFAFMILAAMVVWRIGTRSRLAGLAVLWIFVFLAPAFLGIPAFMRGEWIHDRYLYLPSFGFCLLLVQIIAQFSSERELFGVPAAQTATVLLLAAAMALGTTFEALPWTNDFTLFLHAARLQPNSAPAQAHLATEFYRRGDREDAELRYQESLRLDPTNWKNRLAYGLMLFYTERYEKSDQELQKSIAVQPYDSNTYFYQGMDRFSLGNFAGAEQAFREAIRTGRSRTRYHFWLGFALESQGRLAEARTEYQTELTEHPDTDTPARQRLQRLRK
ncbi:MAG: tetratricopeptide repeat protein [Terriglobales bacterium]